MKPHQPQAQILGAKVILFDGECQLCSGVVRYVLRKTPRSSVQFIPQQSTAGKTILKLYATASENLSTVFYIKDGQIFSKSDAIIEIALELGGSWRLLGILKIFPRPVRDYVYGIVARRRYGIFGRRTVCFYPNQKQPSKPEQNRRSTVCNSLATNGVTTPIKRRKEER